MPDATPIAPGQAAPDFTLPDQNRNEWHLADHVKQGPVVLCFFPFAFTGVCSTENACISKEMADWKAKGATVVAVSCDSFAALKAWGEQSGFEHTMLSDLHRAVVKPYGLYWADMNVANRGTVVIGQADDGKGEVLWSDAREPGDAMDFDAVLAKLS